MDICAKIQERVDAQAKPTLEVLSALRIALESYQAVHLSRCRHAVETAIVKLLGAAQEPEPSTKAAEAALLAAMAGVRAYLALEKSPESPKLPEDSPPSKLIEPVGIPTPISERARPVGLDVPSNEKATHRSRTRIPIPITSYPFIKQGLSDKAICMVGGFNVPGKLDSIYEQTGLKIEWEYFDKGRPRFVESISDRIKGGRIGAVILLEGLMTHKDFHKIRKACKTRSVPCLMAHKGGQGHLIRAFAQLEDKFRQDASAA
jgi:hypothetical protein